MKAKTSTFTATQTCAIYLTMYLFRNMSKVGDGYYVGILYFQVALKTRKLIPTFFGKHIFLDL